jgi:hypothetical protein
MRPATGLLALLGSALVMPQATAFEPADAVFGVQLNYAGQQHWLVTDKVPLLPEDACFAWWLQAPADARLETLTEQLVLPAAPAQWGGPGLAEGGGVQISADGTIATSSFPAVPDAEGWLSNGWCISAGDPLGAHRVDVLTEGELIHSFAFEVVPPAEFDWPAIPQPDPSTRSVNRSW